MADLLVASTTTVLKNSFGMSLNKFLDQPPKVSTLHIPHAS